MLLRDPGPQEPTGHPAPGVGGLAPGAAPTRKIQDPDQRFLWSQVSGAPGGQQVEVLGSGRAAGHPCSSFAPSVHSSTQTPASAPGTLSRKGRAGHAHCRMVLAGLLVWGRPSGTLGTLAGGGGSFVRRLPSLTGGDRGPLCPGPLLPANQGLTYSLYTSPPPPRS